MELTWIEDFLALCQTRNFTRAAVARASTQPAFSRRLQRLEEWLGAPLIQRGVRPVALTPEGQAFLPRAQRLREDMRDARRAVQSLASHYKEAQRLYTTNTLAIGFYPSWARERGLMKGLTKTTLVVASITACLEALAAGRADMALVPRLGDMCVPHDVDIEIVGKESLSLVALPDVAAQVVLKGKSLQGPLLMYTPRTGYGAEIVEKLNSKGIKLAEPPLCESASAEALAAQVRAGLGAAWIPQSLVSDPMVSCSVPHFLSSQTEILLLQRAGR
ncbi:MAG: LysR family transcriptional regulator [Bdellovibrionales bacterium]